MKRWICREKMSERNVIVRPVVSKQFCSSSSKVFTVRKRPCTINGGGFVVMDYSHRDEIFTLDGCGPAVKDHAVLKDAEGNAVLYIKRQVGIMEVLSLHKKWKGFVQDNIDGDEKTIFKASRSICSGKESVKVWLIEGKGKKGWDYQIVGNFAERACAIYNDSHAIAAKVRINEMVEDAIGSKDVYNVEVEAGIDQAFVFGLVAVLHKLTGEDGN